MKILIIKPSSLGDILHTFPAVALIRRHIPDADISWIASENLTQIVNLLPGISRVIPFPRGKMGRLAGFIRDLRRDSYDAVLDFQGLLRSGLMTWLARTAPKAPKIGFAAAREGAPLFYNRNVVVPPQIVHALDKNLLLASEFLGIPFEPADRQPALAIPNDARKSALQKLGNPPDCTPILGIGFSSRWNSKNWPSEFFADTVKAAARQIPGLKVWLLGGREDTAAGDALKHLIGPDADVVNLAGATSLLELAALLAASGALLTNDSGPMHIASALNVPCVALFGATSPEKTGPYGTIHTIVRSKCPHSPCFKRDCPFPMPGGCCAGISVQDVASKLVDLLH